MKQAEEGEDEEQQRRKKSENMSKKIISDKNEAFPAPLASTQPDIRIPLVLFSPNSEFLSNSSQ